MGLVGAQKVVRLLVALVSAVVPVDAVDHRGETAHDEGHLPVAFVVDLPGAGEDAGQRGGFLDLRDVVGAVVDRRVADEVGVGGDGESEVELAPRVAADHARLQGVEFGRAGEAAVGDGLVFALERFIAVVFVDEERETGAQGAVEDRQLPVLLVVDLTVAGHDGRYPAHLRKRHGVAHEPPFAVGSAPDRVGRGGSLACAASGEACGRQGVERDDVVGAEFVQQNRVGPEFGREQRIERGYFGG